MTRKLLNLLLFALCVSFAACSDGDDYNANTAESHYKPVEGRRMVAQVKTVNTVDGRNYSWEHNFTYDVHGRIKEINSKMLHHRAKTFDGLTRWYECNITSKAYYYYRGEKLEVYYRVEKEYPEYPDWDSVDSDYNYGTFKESGVLEEFATIDFEYSGTTLQRAYVDGGDCYEFERNRGNVTGFMKYVESADSVIKDMRGEYIYAERDKNMTNFDFAAYFGYWEVEQNIIANRAPYYASYQLAAFGMLGSTSPNLPLGQVARDGKGNVVTDSYGQPMYVYGDWEVDSSGYPVAFTDATGRKTTIRYVE